MFLSILIIEAENVKRGPVSDEDLTDIGAKVQGKRKRLGRALGLKDHELDVIERENPKKIHE